MFGDFIGCWFYIFSKNRCFINVGLDCKLMIVMIESALLGLIGVGESDLDGIFREVV